MKIADTPVKRNMLANLGSVGVNLCRQILLVPIFLSFWGVDLYSDWIVLTAIAAFFSMTDVGLNTVTSNRFSIKFARSNYDECRKLLTNNYLLLMAVMAIITVASAVFAWCSDLVDVFDLHVIDNTTARWTFLLLVVQIFFGMFSGVLNAVYRANSLTHRATVIEIIALVAELTLLLVGIIAGWNMGVIVALYIVPRILMVVYKSIDTQRLFAYRFSFRYADWPLFKELVVPSLAFVALPAGNAIMLQGYTLVVNNVFGAGVLVLFNTTRTLSNFVKSFVSQIRFAVWPEYSIAYGKNERQQMQRFRNVTVWSSVVITLLAAVVLLIFGTLIFRLWTQSHISFDFWLMFVFLVVITFNNYWNAESMTLLATNRHTRMCMWYLVFSALSLVVAVAVSPLHSLIVVTLCQLVSDIPMSAYVYGSRSVQK